MKDNKTLKNFAGSAFMLFLLVYAILLSFWIIPLVVETFLRRGHSPEEINAVIRSPWTMMGYQLVGLLLPLGIWLAVKRDKLSLHLPNMKLGATNVILIICVSIFMQPGLMLVSGITNLVFPNQVGALLVETAVYPLWLMLLAAAVTPAIIEELVFRGYIQSNQKHLSIRKMAVLNGLFFAMIHLNPHQFFFAFIGGVIFAYMVHYTRSIRAGILSHFILNGTQVTLVHFAARALEWAETVMDDLGDTGAVAGIPAETGINYELAGIAGIAIVAMLATPCAVILYRTFLSHNRQRNTKHDMAQMFKQDAALLSQEAPPEQRQEQDAPPEEPGEPETPAGLLSRLPFDPFVLAVSAIYIWIILLIISVT